MPGSAAGEGGAREVEESLVIKVLLRYSLSVEGEADLRECRRFNMHNLPSLIVPDKPPWPPRLAERFGPIEACATI